jgi:DNA-binding FadR family transcriptional regulator
VATSDSGSQRPAPRIIGQKVVRPRAQVEQKIRAAILSGELRGGERLPSEDELGKQFGVSRTTVREALRALCAQGLITKSPGVKGGSFVQDVDHESLGLILQESLDVRLKLGTLHPDEVAMVRQYLELPAVRLAAEHRSARDLAALREIVAREKSIAVDDSDVADLDARFHSTIAAASGNRAVASFVRALHAVAEPVHNLRLSPEVGRETVRHHQAILVAIDSGDPDAAEAAMLEHLGYLREHLASAEQDARTDRYAPRRVSSGTKRSTA